MSFTHVEREIEIYRERKKQRNQTFANADWKRESWQKEKWARNGTAYPYTIAGVCSLSSVSLSSLSCLSLSLISSYIFSPLYLSLSSLCGLSVVRNSIYKSEYEVEKDQTHIISVIIININRVTWVREGDSLCERCLGVTQIQRSEKMPVSIFGKSRREEDVRP